MATTKLVVIESPGKIAALGGMVGPIRTPSIKSFWKNSFDKNEYVYQ